MHVGPEVLEGVHADNRIELAIVEGQLPGVSVDGGHVVGDPGSVDHRLQVSYVDPVVKRYDVDVCFRAKNTDVAPRPQPRSSTRSPLWSWRAGSRLSNCHNG